MKLKILACIAIVSAALVGCKNNTHGVKLYSNPPATVSGFVTDSLGRGIEGVVVSDGFTCAATDRNGEYSLSTCRFSYYVYLSLPEAYEVPVSDGYPCFYQKLSSGKDRYDFSLTALPDGPETDFCLVSISDPQCRFDNELARFRTETVPDVSATVAGSDIPCYGVALGDIGYNRAELDVTPIFPRIKEEMGKCGLPIFVVMGNHDNSVVSSISYSVKNDIRASRYFENLFGPLNYSFNRGSFHIICMENILFRSHRAYKAGFRDDQVEWLRQDLSYVPKDKSIVLCIHAPLFDGLEKQNVQAVLGLLDGFTDHYHVLTGHHHRQNNYINETYYEHNQSSAMGALWTSTIAADGTPNGYVVYRMSGNDVADWYFKGTGLDRDFQIRLYRASDVFMPEGDPNFQFDHNGPDQIVANVFNADPTWKVEVYEDGEYSGEMTNYTGHDAWAVGYLKGVIRIPSGAYTARVNHMYYYTLHNPEAEVEVRATDCFGNVYTQSVFTTNSPEDYPAAPEPPVE